MKRFANAMSASVVMTVAATLAVTSADAGKIEWVYEKDGRVWLFGGHGEGQDFDITDLTLDHRKLNFGFGREAFPALLEAEFGRPGEENVRVDSSTRVIALVVGGEARAYPLELMQHHETVNDVVAGKPVLVAYCILADLAAVYDRRVAGRTLTFAPSGYTYAIPGVLAGANVFVLWDRETESLWLPSISLGVSAAMRGVALEPLAQRMGDTDAWGVTSWEKLAARHPEALVLKSGQRPVRRGAETGEPEAADSDALRD